MKMIAVLFAAALCLTSFTGVESTNMTYTLGMKMAHTLDLTPLEKVEDLLDGIKNKTIGEEKEAYILYLQNNVLCDKDLLAVSFLIDKDFHFIDELSAELREEMAALAAMIQRVHELVTTIAQKTAELKAAEIVREAEKAEHAKVMAEIEEMIPLLREAQRILTEQKISMAQLGSSATVAQTLQVIVQAEGFSNWDINRMTAFIQDTQAKKEAEKKQALDDDPTMNAFLQEKQECTEEKPDAPSLSGVAECEGQCLSKYQCEKKGCCNFYIDPTRIEGGYCKSSVGESQCLNASQAYESKTGDIIEVLADTLEKAEEEHAAELEREGKRNSSHVLLMKLLTHALENAKKDLRVVRGDEYETEEEKAMNEADLKKRREKLTIEERTRELTREQCIENAKAFTEESRERQKEVVAVMKAMNFIHNITEGHMEDKTPQEAIYKAMVYCTGDYDRIRNSADCAEAAKALLINNLTNPEQGFTTPYVHYNVHQFHDGCVFRGNTEGTNPTLYFMDPALNPSEVPHDDHSHLGMDLCKLKVDAMKGDDCNSLPPCTGCAPDEEKIEDGTCCGKCVPKAPGDEGDCFENGIDYPGNDVEKTSSVTALGCQEKCAATTACSFFSWESEGTDTCWLKSSAPQSVSSQHRISGPKHCQVAASLNQMNTSAMLSVPSASGVSDASGLSDAAGVLSFVPPALLQVKSQSIASSATLAHASLDTYFAAVHFVHELGIKQHSKAISQLAMRMSNGIRHAAKGVDQFTKVKDMIVHMIEKLELANLNEQEEREYCAGQIDSCKHSIADRRNEVGKAQADHDSALALFNGITRECAEISKSLMLMAATFAKENDLRNKEKELFEREKSEITRTQAAVRNAVTALKQYYHVEEENQRSSDASNTVFSLLEVVMQDMDMRLADIIEFDRIAAEEFAESTRQHDLQRLTSQEDLRRMRIRERDAKKKLGELADELAHRQQELEEAYKTWEVIKARCTHEKEDLGERLAKMQAEMDGLKEGLAILKGETANMNPTEPGERSGLKPEQPGERSGLKPEQPGERSGLKPAQPEDGASFLQIANEPNSFLQSGVRRSLRGIVRH